MATGLKSMDNDPLENEAGAETSTAPSPPPPPPPNPSGCAPAAEPAPSGAYGLWTVDKDGGFVDYTAGGKPNPSATKAVEIFFGVLPSHTPPQDQSDLQISIAEVLNTAKKLYISADGDQLPTFRLVYTRLFRIAQLGLEGDAAPAIAKSALDRLIADIIDEEGGRVKNKHLAQLGSRAAMMAAAFLVGYLLLSALSASPLLPALTINPLEARSFLILWIGCSAGVWLSYAIRTTTFTLRDLTISDSDRLLPLTRLVFAGLLTMALGLLLALGWADLKVGKISLADFVNNPTEALLLGLFCGVSELLLPGIVVKRASDILGKLR